VSYVLDRTAHDIRFRHIEDEFTGKWVPRMKHLNETRDEEVGSLSGTEMEHPFSSDKEE
jgi:hypothetical protein